MSIIDRATITMHPLYEYLTEYKELNSDNKYRPVAVGRYGIRTRESIYSKELAKDYSKNRLISKGTLTVGMGSVQMDIGILSDDAIYSVSPAYHTYKIAGIDYDYLRYCLQCRTMDMFARYMRRGSRQGKSIDLDRWITYEIPVYPVQAQKAIVERLDRVQRVIDARQRELSDLDELIKARFVEMFGNPEINPKGWKKEPLKDHATVFVGYPFPSDGYTAEGIDIVGGYNLMQGYILWNESKRWPDIDGYEHYLLQANDIVMAMDRPWVNGGFKIARIDAVHLPALLIQRTACIRGKDLEQEFLHSLLDTQRFAEHCNITGSLVPHISNKDINSFQVIVPPSEEQKRFTAFVAQVDKSKVAVQKALDEAQLLFDSLMQQYFG